MKITDFCIIFALVELCMITVMDVRSNEMYERIYLANRYNIIMDNAVEDALLAAFESVDGNGEPVVNLTTASDYLLEELSIMLDGNTYMSLYYRERVPLIMYTKRDGFYYHDGSGWSEIQYYSHKEDTEHSDRIHELLSFVRNRYGIVLSVPLNDGESYENTIADYSLLAVYKDYDGFYSFSAAKISEKEETV